MYQWALLRGNMQMPDNTISHQENEITAIMRYHDITISVAKK